MRSQSLSLFTVLIFGAVACSPDRDARTYAQEQSKNDLAKAQQNAGTYIGALKLNSDHSDLGPAGITIGTASVPTTFNESKAVLTGVLVFQGSTSITLNFTNGNYDPSDNSFTLALPYGQDLLTGQAKTISMSGKFYGDHLTGTLQVIGEPETSGANFDLTKKSDIKDVQGYLTNEGVSGKPVETYKAAYRGQTQVGGKMREVDIVVTNEDLPKELRFAGFFEQRKTVQVQVSFADPADSSNPGSKIPVKHQTLFFANAERNQITGDVRATNTASGSTGSANAGTRSLNCEPKTRADINGSMNCVLSNTNVGSFYAEFNVDPVAAGAK